MWLNLRRHFDFGPITNKRYQINIQRAENLNKLFPVMGGKFKFSAQESDLVFFVGNETKDKKPSKIKPPVLN